MASPGATSDDFTATSPTWKQWWRDQPKYVQLGLWAVRVTVLLHLAIALRIAWGWREAADIAELRNRNVVVTYFWEARPNRFPYEDLLWAGWYGRDWRSISRIRWRAAGGRDSELLKIGRRCRRLKELNLENANFSARAIDGLGNCHSLEELNLEGTNTDDGAISHFRGLRRLQKIRLAGTLVSDESLAVLYDLPQLRSADLSHTNVTLAGIDSWRGSRELPLNIMSERLYFPQAPVASLCWSDGEKSVRFPSRFKVVIDGPADSEGQQLITTRSEFARRSRWCFKLQHEMRVDDEYQLMIRFGSIESHPLRVDVENRKPSIINLEFQMPCTKAEALRTLFVN